MLQIPLTTGEVTQGSGRGQQMNQNVVTHCALTMYLLTALPLHAKQIPANVASCITSSSGDLAPNPTIDNMSRGEASGALIVSATIL